MRTISRSFLAAAAVCAALLAPAVSPRAASAADPKQIETDWSYRIYFASFTGVTTGLADIAGLGGAVTPGLNVVGHAWSILSVGGDAKFTIAHATKTYNSGAVNASGFNNSFPLGLVGVAPSISTSPVIMAVSGFPLSGTFEDLTKNPVFTFTTLSAAATTYLWVEYGRDK